MKLTKEDKQLIKEGEYWNGYFTGMIGHIIVDGNDDLRALGYAMRKLKEGGLKNAKIPNGSNTA